MTRQIMVVDDEASILLLLDVSLRRRGFTVLKANDSYKALAMLDSSTPDLFILDVMMPGMDGLELCKHIRSRPQTAQTPVIMYSARCDEWSIERGFAAGATAYLSKTTSHADIVSSIRSILGPDTTLADLANPA